MIKRTKNCSLLATLTAFIFGINVTLLFYGFLLEYYNIAVADNLSQFQGDKIRFSDKTCREIISFLSRQRWIHCLCQQNGTIVDMTKNLVIFLYKNTNLVSRYKPSY